MCRRVWMLRGSIREKGRELYRKDHKFPKLLHLICSMFVDNSPYPKRCGTHLEFRPGMLNVSVVGRKATNAQRSEYYEWDQMTNERSGLVDLINRAPCPTRLLPEVKSA